MESLESLNKFLEALINFSWVDNISFIGRVQPDIDVDLKNATPKWRFFRFTTNIIGVMCLKDLISSEGKNIQVKEIRLTTYPGSIRVSNEEYPQKQLATKKVLGWNLDIMPRKKDKPEGNSQIVIINSAEVKRFGDPKFTRSFLTDELKAKIDDFNIKHAKPAVALDIPFKLQDFVRRNSVQFQ